MTTDAPPPPRRTFRLPKPRLPKPRLPKPRLPKPRLTIAGSLIVIALIAVAIAFWLSRSTRIIDLKIGTGPAVAVGDRVEVHYVLRLKDGDVIDTSRTSGNPFGFVVGQGAVISGFQTGVVGMRAGGVRHVTVPSNEAYGKEGASAVVPPNSTLVFEIELIQIH